MKPRCLLPFATAAKIVATSLLMSTIGPSPLVHAAPQQAPMQNKKRGAAPFNLRAVLETANRYYETGRLNDALIGYSAILQRYPAHTAAIVQSAKIYYRMDRYTEAGQLFSRVAVTELDPETSYEYGWSHFNLHNYDAALRGFQRVPPGHSLADLANYYGGIAAIKLRRFDVAEDMLEKALVLPDKLAKSRGLYLKHVQALRLMHQQHELARERELERETLAMAVPKRKPKTDNEIVPIAEATAPAVSQAPTPPPAQLQGFKTVQRIATMSYLAEQQITNNHGRERSKFDAKIATFDVITGPQTALPIWRQSKDRTASVGLQIDLGLESRDQEGTEQTLWAGVSDHMLARQLNQRLGTKAELYAHAAGDAWLEVPVGATSWFDIGVDGDSLFGDFQRRNSLGYRRGYSDWRCRCSFGVLGISAVYREIVDNLNQPIVQGSGGNIYVNSEVATKLVLGVDLGYQNLTYIDQGEGLDGPDSLATVQFNAVQGLPLNLKITASASYQQQSNFQFHNIPNYAQLSADGGNIFGRASFEGSPLPFLNLGASALVSSTSWQLKDDATKDAFELAVPSYTQELNLWAGINLLF